MKPFIIYALPRSRTYWLSRFLSYGEWFCGHDEMRHARSLDDVRAWFKLPCFGTVETAGAPWWRLVQKIRPDVVTVTIRRDPWEVVESLRKLGFKDTASIRTQIVRLDAKLDQIEARVPNVLRVNYHALRSEFVCATLFEHCLGYDHNSQWWESLAAANLQINMAPLLRYYDAYRPQLDKLAAMARQNLLADMAKNRSAERDDIVIAQETFDTFLRDGRSLFAEHLIEVGEHPDAWAGKNLPLMSALEQIGCLHITTARSNGRMFGYLMAVISPSLEAEGRLSALHTTFYASKEFPTLGRRLRKASIDDLRAKGVHELLMRAGTRGDGPRLPALFQRMGAEDAGRLFTLELQAA